MVEPSMSRLSLLATVLLVALAAVRWHESAAAAPDRVEGMEGPAAVLVVQPGDCPERSAAMMRWLAGFKRGDGGQSRLQLAVAVLGDDTDALDRDLTALPRLGPVDTRSVARAILRSGAPGTPALVLVGMDGTVLTADTFAPGGVGRRLLDAADLLGTLRVSFFDGDVPTHSTSRRLPA